MWRDRINVLDKKRNRILQAGGADRIEKQHKSGKLTARERIDMLFDPGTFVEVDSFIESRIDDFGLDKKRVPGDGVVTDMVRSMDVQCSCLLRTLQLSEDQWVNIIP